MFDCSFGRISSSAFLLLSAAESLEMATESKGIVLEELLSQLADDELRRHGQSHMTAALNLSYSYRGEQQQPLSGRTASLVSDGIGRTARKSDGDRVSTLPKGGGSGER